MLPSSKEGGVSLALDYHGTPAEQLEKLFKDCGVSPDKVCHARFHHAKDSLRRFTIS